MTRIKMIAIGVALLAAVALYYGVRVTILKRDVAALELRAGSAEHIVERGIVRAERLNALEIKQREEDVEKFNDLIASRRYFDSLP